MEAGQAIGEVDEVTAGAVPIALPPLRAPPTAHGSPTAAPASSPSSTSSTASALCTISSSAPFRPSSAAAQQLDELRSKCGVVSISPAIATILPPRHRRRRRALRGMVALQQAACRCQPDERPGVATGPSGAAVPRWFALRPRCSSRRNHGVAAKATCHRRDVAGGEPPATRRGVARRPPRAGKWEGGRGPAGWPRARARTARGHQARVSADPPAEDAR